MEEQLATEELNKIFAWQPYRPEWPIDRNVAKDNIDVYYGALISDLTTNDFFNSYCSQDGGLGNYLEFLCYPANNKIYDGNAVAVCVSLCAPVAAYGQIAFAKDDRSTSWGELFEPQKIGIVSDESLAGIASAIKNILEKNNLLILDNDFAGQLLPDEMLKNPGYENLNAGNQYFHGIFQQVD